MDRKRKATPKKAANGKKAAKTAKKRTRNDEGNSDPENIVTGHLEDAVTIALPHENDTTHKVDTEDVKIVKPTAPKLTDQQLLDSLTLPSADAPSSKPQAQASATDLETPDSDLPNKYAQLEQFFHALLNVYLCLQARKQSCTWSLMKEPIESTCNTHLHLSHISQMQTVIPNAIKLSVWKHTTTNKLGKELVVEISSPATSQPLAPSTLLELRQTFHEKLLELVKQHHTAFLAKGKLKQPKAPKKWHPKFDLESVPDIPLTPLPSELTEIPKQNTEIKEDKLDLATIEKYIEAKPIPAELVGLSAATIAAAREREEVIMEESEEVKLMRMLPVVVRAVHGLCVVEKKRAFKRAHLIAQLLSCSAAPLSHDEAVRALDKLGKLVPQWVSVYRADDEVEWVRFSRDLSMAKCLEAIQKDGKK
eukprot:Phypoly_transcript_09621.p1 GENE.Phypoly_transcript_09621~~Phypoly_transcript_09621.p1  ORF type:complete len:421 (+),score=114.12 Phypoly_transcript_09621:108-1370(+)